MLAAEGNAGHLASALRDAVEVAEATRSSAARIDVAWTYPGSARPGLRTTGGVSRELIRESRSSLLVVGYAISVDADRTGLAAQTINEIAAAARKGVVITAIFHRQANRNALIHSWPAGVKEPTVYTWPQADDPMASLHAKLVVGDRRDALVTSANLTYHGYEGNIEMGLRVKGRPAAEIHDRFMDLIAARILVEWA